MSSMTYSAAMPTGVDTEARRHLLRPDGQEDVCFAIWYPSRGSTRTTALVQALILPRKGERRVHGNASVLPAYFERAVAEAVNAGGGLALLHSHPGPGWQDMSDTDVRAERGYAAAAKGATGLPLVGLTIGSDGSWSARWWEKTAPRTYQRRWCTHVRVVGERLGLTYNNALVPRPAMREEWRRTVSAWGEETQADLVRLRIGVVGLGSVGAIVAEALARTGVGSITLIDFDSIEHVNLDRLLHATRFDALLQCSKVAALGRALRRSATATNARLDEYELSVVEEEGFRAALDCDVLFSCVDRPWPRCVLNFIAYAHLIPVVDGGIRIDVGRRGRLRAADWRAHVAAPTRPCLACLGQYDPGQVTVEREGYLDDPTYIQGLAATDPARRNENVFAFSTSVASLELLQMLAMVIAPVGIGNLGAQFYHFVPGILDEPRMDPCDPSCAYPPIIARGDRAGFVVTGRHARAEAVRQGRAAARRVLPWRYRTLSHLIDALDEAVTRAERAARR